MFSSFVLLFLCTGFVYQPGFDICAKVKMSTQASSQKGNGADMPDRSAYGIAPSGEPAEAVNCMGERVAALPFQRRVEFRAGKDGKPLLKDVLEVSRNTAAWVQTRGVQVPQPCSNCAAGNGPFTACVVLRMPNNQRFSDGSCANCYFGHSGSRCSLREFVFWKCSKCDTDTDIRWFNTEQSFCQSPGSVSIRTT